MKNTCRETSVSLCLFSRESEISRPLKASGVISQLVNTCRAQGHQGRDEEHIEAKESFVFVL